MHLSISQRQAVSAVAAIRLLVDPVLSLVPQVAILLLAPQDNTLLLAPQDNTLLLVDAVLFLVL